MKGVVAQSGLKERRAKGSVNVDWPYPSPSMAYVHRLVEKGPQCDAFSSHITLCYRNAISLVLQALPSPRYAFPTIDLALLASRTC